MTTQALQPKSPILPNASRSAARRSRVSAPPVALAKDEPLGYRINDASRASGIGRTSIYKLIAEGKLEVVKVAGRSIIVGASLRALFDVSR